MFYEAGLMLEQYLFIGLFIGGLFGLVLTFTRRGKKTFGLELAIAFVLFAAGVFGPTLFSFPPTPYVLFPSLSYTTAPGGTITASSPGGTTVSRSVPPSSGSGSDGTSSGVIGSSTSSGTSTKVVTSTGTVTVVDSGSNVPVTGIVVTATDDKTGISVSVKTDSRGIVPIKTIVSTLADKISASQPPGVEPTASAEPSGQPSVGATAEPSTAPEEGVAQDVTLVTKTLTEETTQNIQIDDSNPQATASLDVSVEVLPPLSDSFVQQAGGIDSVSAEPGIVVSGSPVLVPIAPSDIMAPPGLLTGQEGGPQLEFRRELKTVDVMVNGREQRLSTIELRIKNSGNIKIENLVVNEDFRGFYNLIRERRRQRGLSAVEVDEKITLVGVSAEPVELKSGEFAKWLFSSIEPGEEARVSYTVDTAVDESVVGKLAAPVAVAVSNEPLKVVVKQQSSFDTTAVIGLILASAIVCAIAVFFVRRQ